MQEGSVGAYLHFLTKEVLGAQMITGAQSHEAPSTYYRKMMNTISECK